jgi:hypothetical protein
VVAVRLLAKDLQNSLALSSDPVSALAQTFENRILATSLDFHTTHLLTKSISVSHNQLAKNYALVAGDHPPILSHDKPAHMKLAVTRAL